MVSQVFKIWGKQDFEIQITRYFSLLFLILFSHYCGPGTWTDYRKNQTIVIESMAACNHNNLYLDTRLY